VQTPRELPVRAWQAVVELRDTPRRIDGSQDKPFPSVLGRWFARWVKAGRCGRKPLLLTPVTF